MNSLCSSSEALTEPNGFTCVESETMSHSCYLFLGSQINKKPILPLALVTHSCLTPSQSRPADWWGYVNTVGERESSHLIWSRRTNKLVLWGGGGVQSMGVGEWAFFYHIKGQVSSSWLCPYQTPLYGSSECHVTTAAVVNLVVVRHNAAHSCFAPCHYQDDCRGKPHLFTLPDWMRSLSVFTCFQTQYRVKKKLAVAGIQTGNHSQIL